MFNILWKCINEWREWGEKRIWEEVLIVLVSWVFCGENIIVRVCFVLNVRKELEDRGVLLCFVGSD